MHDATLSYLNVFLSLFPPFGRAPSLFLFFSAPWVEGGVARSIFQTLSIISAPGGLYACRGILPWWRRVAASLKFHTRWPTYRNPYLRHAWPVHPPSNILKTSYRKSRPITHLLPRPPVPPPQTFPRITLGNRLQKNTLLVLPITCHWILQDLHESSNGRIVSRDWERER